jgi:hypothetical protein
MTSSRSSLSGLAWQDIPHCHGPRKLLQLSGSDYFAEVKNGSFGSDESCRQFIADTIPPALNRLRKKHFQSEVLHFQGLKPDSF